MVAGLPYFHLLFDFNMVVKCKKSGPYGPDFLLYFVDTKSFSIHTSGKTAHIF
jgi:hypothetical protein